MCRMAAGSRHACSRTWAASTGSLANAVPASSRTSRLLAGWSWYWCRPGSSGRSGRRSVALSKVRQERHGEIVLRHHFSFVHEAKPIDIDRQTNRRLLDDAAAERSATGRDPAGDLPVLEVELHEDLSALRELRLYRVGAALDME